MKENIYLNQLDNIMSVGDQILDDSKMNISINNPQKNTFPDNFVWKSLETGNVFKLNFVGDDNSKSVTKVFTFKDGVTSVKLSLNEDLTEKNNPRAFPLKNATNSIFKNLTLPGKISIKGNTDLELSLSCNFFQNKLPSTIIKKTDWVHDIGPVLKRMGLLYPSMQRVVNLYHFMGLSMYSMKRAFDVEDENHPRYMPSTR